MSKTEKQRMAMAKVLLWLSDSKKAQSFFNMLVAAGHDILLIANSSDIGPLAKAEWRAKTPIEVAVVEVNHDWTLGQALFAVQRAKEIQPPVKIIALCCCTKGVDDARKAGCDEALINDYYKKLLTAIPFVLVSA